jgi:hypothetical protein
MSIKTKVYGNTNANAVLPFQFAYLMGKLIRQDDGAEYAYRHLSLQLQIRNSNNSSNIRSLLALSIDDNIIQHVYVCVYIRLRCIHRI